MKLKVNEWGEPSADRTALLVHGVMSSHATWVRVAPLLAARGYHVIAPDLRGHGESPCADSYQPADFAADLVDTVPPGVDLAIGHSLGGLALALAEADLAPARVVYSDPAWRLTRLRTRIRTLAAFAGAAKTLSADHIARMNPRWSPEDVAAEVEGLAAWDLAVTRSVSDFGDLALTPPERPTLVLAADPSFLVPPDVAAELAGHGYLVQTVPATGHVIHRDDLPGFMAALTGWID